MFEDHIEKLHSRTQALREKLFQRWWRHIFLAFGALALLAIALVLMHAALFGPPGGDTTRSEFVVTPEESLETIASDLENQGYVKYAFVLRFAYAATRGEATVRPGGYEISRDMDAWTLAKVLSQAPYLAWITIPDGTRKEEIADILTTDLGWTELEKAQWLAAASSTLELSDGIYYPDTYLIPSDQPPADIAARMRGRFEEVFASYEAEAAEKKLAWADVVTMASIIEREAAKNDKSLIAGILWNRIHKHMLLQVDATLQYIEGAEGNWWPPPDTEDKTSDSPFNTYKITGLPPHPISNPSIASIDAVLNPEKTSCLYYLHDQYGRIHCSPTYAGQKANVARYLK